MGQHFRDGLLDNTTPTPVNLRDGLGRPAGRRYNVYRNNILSSLIEALEANFPTVQSLLGSENFTHLARDFIRHHPPRSQILAQYGVEFATFIAGHPNLAQLPYLKDIAKIDHLVRESYHAADHVALMPDQLAAIPAETLGDHSICLAPSLRFTVSPYPLYDIWQFANGVGPAPTSGTGQGVLIIRAAFDPEVLQLTPDEVAALQHLFAGKSLVQASRDCDITALLSNLIAKGAISQIYKGDQDAI